MHVSFIIRFLMMFYESMMEMQLLVLDTGWLQDHTFHQILQALAVVCLSPFLQTILEVLQDFMQNCITMPHLCQHRICLSRIAHLIIPATLRKVDATMMILVYLDIYVGMATVPLSLKHKTAQIAVMRLQMYP